MQRLTKMGVKVDQRSGKSFAEGELELSATPFETLAEPIRMERARFYTLGFNRLKFYHPKILFSLPPLDVARCESRGQLESALRRLWATQTNEAREALRWLRELGIEPMLASGSTQVLVSLTGEDGPPARVVSRTEVQLPSAGPLAHVSLTAPVDRRHRPGRNLQDASDLEIEISAAMAQASKRVKTTPEEGERVGKGPPPQASEVHRILVLDHDRATLTAAESLLIAHGYQAATFQDPERALQAFRARSYEILLTTGTLSRSDGLEFVALARALPGMENLPVVLMDDRFTMRQKRDAAAMGVSAFFEKPLSWPVIGPTLMEMLERPPMRRFRRVPVELAVQTECAEGEAFEVTEEISRCGLRLRTQREVFPDAVERYRIKLADPFGPVLIEGQVRSRMTVPGETSVLAGIRIFRFLEGDEAHWIGLIEQLIQSSTEKDDL